MWLLFLFLTQMRFVKSKVDDDALLLFLTLPLFPPLSLTLACSLSPLHSPLALSLSHPIFLFLSFFISPSLPFSDLSFSLSLCLFTLSLPQHVHSLSLSILLYLSLSNPLYSLHSFSPKLKEMLHPKQRNLCVCERVCMLNCEQTLIYPTSLVCTIEREGQSACVCVRESESKF